MSVYFVIIFTLFPRSYQKAKGIGKKYSSQITVSYKDFLNCFSSPSCYFRHIIIPGLLKNN